MPEIAPVLWEVSRQRAELTSSFWGGESLVCFLHSKDDIHVHVKCHVLDKNRISVLSGYYC